MSDCEYNPGYVDDDIVLIHCSNGIAFSITHEASVAIVNGEDICKVLKAHDDDTVELYSKTGPVMSIQIPIDQEKLRESLKKMYECPCCNGKGYHSEEE